MDKDLVAIYNQYVDGLGALMKLPADIKNMLAIAVKDQSTSETELDKEATTINAKFSKIKMSVEDDYTKIQQELSGVNIPIPARQRPSGIQSNISSVQAFENQKKISDSIRKSITQLKNKDRQAEDEARKAAFAIEERKRLVQERLKHEEQEREKVRKEAEQRRILEEQQRLEAERKATEDKALRKKRLLIFGGIGLIVLLILIFFFL